MKTKDISERDLTVVLRARKHWWWVKPMVVGYRLDARKRYMWYVVRHDGTVYRATLNMVIILMKMIAAGDYPKEAY